MLLCFVQDDYNNFNVKAIVNLNDRGVIYGKYHIWLFVGRPSFTRGRIVVPQNVFSLDTNKTVVFYSRQYENGIWAGIVLFNNWLQFWRGSKNIGKKVSEKIVSNKKRCLLRKQLFPNYTNSSVKIGDLKSFILNQPFLKVDDADAVRVCLIYTFCVKIWIYEMLPAVRACRFVLRKNKDMPQMKRWSGKKN
uniref:Uncharacterized protein n=1 Tax=Lactuca sativa TaxID=4236 RepID=A0A9R1VE67_LACSA|nr:hypothetical protein LSAT_V11C500260150 [Lactuca sativa]